MLVENWVIKLFVIWERLVSLNDKFQTYIGYVFIQRNFNVIRQTVLDLYLVEKRSIFGLTTKGTFVLICILGAHPRFIKDD